MKRCDDIKEISVRHCQFHIMEITTTIYIHKHTLTTQQSALRLNQLEHRMSWSLTVGYEPAIEMLESVYETVRWEANGERFWT